MAQPPKPLASPFDALGKSITDFLGQDRYALDKQCRINIQADDIRWSLTNVLRGGKVTAELDVNYEVTAQDTIGFTTSTAEDLIVRYRTTRLPKDVVATFEAQDPRVDCAFRTQRDKFAAALEASVDASSMAADVTASGVYRAGDKLSIGAEVKAAQGAQGVDLTAYNIGVEFQPAEDKALAIVTGDKLSEVTLAARAQLKPGLTGYGQVDLKDFAPAGFAVGAEKEIGDDSSVAAVSRGPTNFSVLFRKALTPDVRANIAFNLDLTQAPEDRASLEWKFVFSS